MADYDSDEEEMLAREDELRALEDDDGDGADYGTNDDYSSSQHGASSSYRSCPNSRRNSAYSGYSGYSGQSGYSGRSGGDSGGNYDDEDGRQYDHDEDDKDEDDDERSYHTQRSHRSHASARSHGTAGSNTNNQNSSNKDRRSMSKSKKKSKSKSSEPDRPDQLSTIISKEEEDKLLAYNPPPVPLRFSGQYLRGAFGVGDANALGGGIGGNGITMSKKQRAALIRDGLGLNIGPLIVCDDDKDIGAASAGGVATKAENGSDKTNLAPPGSLIYGCRGPAPSSTSPSSAASDPLGLNTNANANANTDSAPVVTAADLLRWLTSLVHHHSIRRILCLLNDVELQSIAPPVGYRRLVESQGVKVTMCDLTQPGARDVALEAMEEAVRAGERIAIHCSGGEHRTGSVMALWLCRYGDGQVVDEDNGDGGTDKVTMAMSPEVAVKRVAAEASRVGVSRHPDVKQVRWLLEEGKLASS